MGYGRVYILIWVRACAISGYGYKRHNRFRSNQISFLIQDTLAGEMLGCAGDFHEFYGHYMRGNDSSPLPYDVASVGNDIRDFCAESGEVKRVGNYFIGKAELGEGMFAKVKKGIHSLTGEQVRLRDGGVAAICFQSL